MHVTVLNKTMTNNQTVPEPLIMTPESSAAFLVDDNDNNYNYCHRQSVIITICHIFLSSDCNKTVKPHMTGAH